jgi:hypothetical protein
MKYSEVTMMQVNEKFVFEKDLYSWTLNYIYEGKDKDGNKKQQTKQTYHSTLKQVANKIVDYSAKETATMDELKSLLSNAENIVEKCLVKMAREEA